MKKKILLFVGLLVMVAGYGQNTLVRRNVVIDSSLIYRGRIIHINDSLVYTEFAGDSVRFKRIGGIWSSWIGTVSGGTGSGSVTSVAAGNGMSFTSITSTGSVILGTPSDITTSSTNSVTSGTHSHAIGIIGPAKGGTGAALTPVTGGVVYTTSTAFAVLAPAGNGYPLISNIAGSPGWGNKALGTAAYADSLNFIPASRTITINSTEFDLSVNRTWTISASTLGLGNVENTALSTWSGSTNITTLGTVSSGTWSGTAIATTKGGTGLTSIATGSVLVANSSNSLSALSSTSGTYYLKNVDGTISWGTVTSGGTGTVTSVAAGNGMSFTSITSTGSVTLGTPSDITTSSSNSVSSGTHSHAIGIIGPTKGGTGVANNVANTLTFTGAYSLGITLAGNTSLTFPTSGTLVTTSGYADNVHLYIGNQTTRANFYHTGSQLYMINNAGNMYLTGSGASNHVYLNTNDGTNYNGNTYTRTQVNGTNDNTLATTAFANTAASSAAAAITKASIGLGSVENTQLSIWSGSTSITQVGTISTGTWSGTAIATTKGGTGLTSIATGSVLVANSGNTLTALASTSGELYLKNTNGTISWASVAASGGGSPRVGTTTTTSSLTIDCSSYDVYNVTTLAGALTINAPSGTPVDGQKLMIRIRDNGTSKALTWNAIFIPFGSTALTATTTYGKWMYFGCIYNAFAVRWDVVGVSVQGGAII